MGCLFGYYGRPEPGLTERMADLLSHRCKRGWEKVELSLGNDYCVEIAHGCAPWWSFPQTASLAALNTAFGYSGVIFNSGNSGGSQKNHHSIEFGTRIGVQNAVNQCTASLESRYAQKIDLAELLPRLNRDPVSALTSLEGCYTGALAAEDEFFLIRDPAGVKVIYWTQTRERIVFASEIKALFADKSIRREMRLAALPEYLTFSFVPAENTMFEDIYELGSGSFIRVKNGTTTRRRYFLFENNEWDGSNSLPKDHYAALVRDALELSVKECCDLSTAAPSCFLSGGIDSSSVLAVAARYSQKPINTFSVHFGEPYVNENEFVSMMVEKYGTCHTWLEIRPSTFMDQMRKIMWFLDDPIGDPITVPNYLLSEAASKVGNMVLNGEGGDPCFGGPKNIPMLLDGIYRIPGEEKGLSAKTYLHTFRKCFSDLDRILDPAVLEASGGEEALAAVVEEFLNAGKPSHYLNKLMAMNIRLKGANLILVKVDKMSSANGILALPPLFSKRSVLASMECPPHFKLAGNIEKAVLKEAVADIVPEPIIKRPKSGMMVPVRFWFRGEMRRYAKKILSRKNLKRVGLFNPDYTASLLEYGNESSTGSKNGLKLWMLITFMLWHDQMLGR